MKPDLTVLDADRHAVAITKRAIAALGTAAVTPASISKKAWEIDDVDARPRGVSTFTLRNDGDCRALLEAHRTFRPEPGRRRTGSVPAHIARMDKAALIDALLADRSSALRTDVALDLIAARLHRHGRKVDRTKLDVIGEERCSLRANHPSGRARAELLVRAKKDHERSMRLVQAGIERLVGRTDFTHADLLREARAADEEGRGLHDDILERNPECADLVRAVKGLSSNGKAAHRPKHLLRLDNHLLGLALACERRYLHAAQRTLAKHADIVIDLELVAVTDKTVVQERQYVREQAELQRDLEALGLA